MNITINLITNLQETVQNTVLSKILAAKRNNGTINLTGNIYISAAYADEVLEFCTYFGLTEDENSPGTYRGNNIILSIGTSYISFQDSEVARIILANFGTDGHITTQLAATARFNNTLFQNNTLILSFPEFDLFTAANTVDNSGYIFDGCTNLSEIDLSNWEISLVDLFSYTAITTVNAPKLNRYGSWYNGGGAFHHCGNLTSVVSLGSITFVQNDMFKECPNLTTVNLPNTCTAIKNFSFFVENGSGSLTTINLDNITSIGTKAFKGQNLLRLTLPQDIPNLLEVGDYAFDECPYISGNINYSNLISLGRSSFFGTNISRIQDLGNVSIIPNQCFRRCKNLTSIEFGNNITELDVSAFNEDSELVFNVSLLPLSLSKLKGYAFSDCSKVTGILNLPNLIEIGENAFSSANITKVENLGNIPTLASRAFQNNKNLTSVEIPSTVTSIGDSCFVNCTSLSTITGLSNITGSIGATCFYNCSGLSLDISQQLLNVSEIKNNAFRSSGIRGIINCPNLNKSLENEVFRGTNITKILDLGACPEIGVACFAECPNLTEVILPSTCTLLREGVFYNSNNISSINVENIVTLGKTVFGGEEHTSFVNCVFYFKELQDLESEKKYDQNGLFETGSLYIYAPKLQRCAGGFDAGSSKIRGLFTCMERPLRMSDHNIVYFKNLSSVETGAFCGGIIKHLIINNITPPTVIAYSLQRQDLLIDVSGSGVSRSVVQNVWVPDSAVNTYKLHQYWGEFGNKIQGLSGMSKVATKALWDQLSASAKVDTLIEEYM